MTDRRQSCNLKGQPAASSGGTRLYDGQLNATTASPRLSVVIATYNRYDVLPGAIDSLLRQKVPPGFLEIIVVDNSPSREDAKRFADRYAGVAPLRYLLEDAPGLSNARNVGTASALADIVAFIDDDAIAGPEWAQEIVAAFDDFPERAGIVGGRVLPRWLKPRPNWLPNDLLGYLSIVDWNLPRGPLPSENWVAGCNIAFKKTALLEVGGFSRALGRKGSGAMLLSNDELEVMEKIHAKGFQTIYVPSALVEHVIDPERLTKSWFRRRAAWQAVSDFVKDPNTAAASASTSNQYLRQSLANKRVISPLGFNSASNDVETFRQEVALAYHLTFSTLSGGDEFNFEPSLAPRSRSWGWRWRMILSHIPKVLLGRGREKVPPGRFNNI